MKPRVSFVLKYVIIAHMKPISTSIFDFPALLANGYVYVDKAVKEKNERSWK